MPTRRPISSADQERSPDPRPADADGREGAGDGDRDEQQHPVEHAPADRAEQPLTEEQRGPDHREDDREDDDRDRDPDEGRDLRDLAARSPRPRPWQGRCGPERARIRGVACRADRAYAGRGVVKGRLSVGRPGCCSGSGWAATERDRAVRDDSSVPARARPPERLSGLAGPLRCGHADAHGPPAPRPPRCSASGPS